MYLIEQDRASLINTKNNTIAGQMKVTDRSLKQGTSNRERKVKEGVILPYRRLGVDISFPNLAEGTCHEASCTYHSKSFGHFPGGKTVRGHGRRDEDFPSEKVSGLKRGRGRYIRT